MSEPPCASAICRASARPTPEPPGLVVKNGTNKLSVFDKPGPSSSIQMSSSDVAIPRTRFSPRRSALDRPADRRTPPGGQIGIDGVAHQVHERPVELIVIGQYADVWPRDDAHARARLGGDDTADSAATSTFFLDGGGSQLSWV